MSYWFVGASLVMSAVGMVQQSNNAKKALAQQKDAQVQAQQNADKAAAQADEDFNRQNQKSPDTQAMLASAMLSGKGGASGTMLTGPGGIDKDKLALQRSTLLGG